MNWNHLPVAGGLYEQHPQLIDEWDVLFDLDAKAQEKHRKEEEAKSKR